MNPQSSILNPRSSDFPLHLSALLMDCAMGALVLVTPWFAHQVFGVSMEQWGLMAVAGAACYSISCLTLGSLSDRVGSRRLCVAGAGICALDYALIPRVSSATWLVVTMMISGLGMSLFWPPVQSWLGRGRNRDELARTVGTFNFFWTVGLMIAPPIAAYLYQGNRAFPYYFTAVCCALVIPLALLVPEASNCEGAKVIIEEASGSIYVVTSVHPLADRLLYASWIANSASWFMLGCVRHLLQFFAPTIHVNETALSVILSLTSVVQLLTFVALARFHTWHYRLPPLLMTQGLAVVGMLVVFMATGPPMLAAGLCLTGICTGASYTSSLFYSTHGRTDAGKKTGLHEGLLAIGLLLGPPLGGWLGQHWTVSAPFLMCAGALMLAMAVEVKIVSSAWFQVRIPLDT